MADKDAGENLAVHTWRDHVLLLRRCRDTATRIAANLPPKQADIEQLNAVIHELEGINHEKGRLTQELDNFKDRFWRLRNAMLRLGTYIPERRLQRLIDDGSSLEPTVPDEAELAVTPAERRDVEEVIEMLLYHVKPDGLARDAAEAMLIRLFWSIRKRVFHAGWNDPRLEAELRDLLHRSPNLEASAGAPADHRA